MSKIKVLTSSGQWSNEILGLDKVNLMKMAIQQEFTHVYASWKEKYRDYCDEDFSIEDFEYNMPLPELEIDCNVILKQMINDNSTSNGHVNWSYFTEQSGVELQNAKTLKMRLSTLQELADSSTYLSAVYKELIAAADIPEPTSGHCLTFKFEEE